MAINVLQAAKHVCKESQWRLSNLELQKILYLCHVVYMGENDGKILISENFQAWKHGPVHPRLYEKLKKFGAKPVPESAFYDIRDLDNNDNEKEYKILSKAAKEIPPGHGLQLVKATHWEGGAWKKNYIFGLKHIVIPDKDIKEEYKNLIERYIK